MPIGTAIGSAIGNALRNLARYFDPVEGDRTSSDSSQALTPTGRIIHKILRSTKKAPGLLGTPQQPTKCFVYCGDSRIGPLLGTRPGEGFNIANIAGMVPEYEDDKNPRSTTAGLVYASAVLKVRTFVVIMHRNCGGVQALLGPDGPSDDPLNAVKNWMAIAKHAKNASATTDVMHKFQELLGDDQTAICTMLILQESLKRLTRIPAIAKRLGEVTITGLFVDHDQVLQMNVAGEIVKHSLGTKDAEKTSTLHSERVIFPSCKHHHAGTPESVRKTPLRPELHRYAPAVRQFQAAHAAHATARLANTLLHRVPIR